MPKRKKTIFIVVFSLTYCLVGCVTTENSLPAMTTTTEMPTSSTINTSIPNNFPTSPNNFSGNSPTSILSATPTLTTVPSLHQATWTPLPTLDPEETQTLLNDLLLNNAGCQLPCYWGITPGKTTWQEAESFLQTFSLVNIRGSVPASGSIAALIPFPKERGTIWHYYGIKQGIVDEIIAYNLDLAPSLYLQSFLKTYGQPSGIWIRTFKEEERNSQPFLIDIFYQEQGILMEYGGGDLNDLGDRIQNCLDNKVNSPLIYLWSPEMELTFKEAKESFLDTENLPEPVSLQEATSMSIEDFYTQIVNSGKVCIETPKVLWP